jgi:hypothetical protein
MALTFYDTSVASYLQTLGEQFMVFRGGATIASNESIARE